jgi:hypothetical protein
MVEQFMNVYVVDLILPKQKPTKQTQKDSSSNTTSSRKHENGNGFSVPYSFYGCDVFYNGLCSVKLHKRVD